MTECLVAIPPKPVSAGILYVEARIQDNLEPSLASISVIQAELEKELSKPGQLFGLGQDLFTDTATYRASLLLRGTFEDARKMFHSLNVVEYIGTNTGTTSYSTDCVQVKVQIYKLKSTKDEEDAFEQGEITSMPHANYDGCWDDLFFEKDLKGDLISIMTNILRFSRPPSKRRADMNPVILLHGKPGTGKTTLCQGLAQKISIRLSHTYKETKLVQIRTATLLSKYYSESAKQVDNIFMTLEMMCSGNPEQFVCVLIDEVESIASSRERSMHGEAQDSLRATNALLTGLDRAKKYSNVVFLCTSNMPECLDAAFLDRCGINIAVHQPTPHVQYEILRNRIHGLISNGVIRSTHRLPPYREAQRYNACVKTTTSEETDLQSLMYDSAAYLELSHGIKLVRIVEAIEKIGVLSGRALKQLPEMSILRYLKGDDCDLDMAFQLIEKSVGEAGAGGTDSSNAHAGAEDDGSRFGKRIREADEDIEEDLGAIDILVTGLRRYSKRLKNGSGAF